MDDGLPRPGQWQASYAFLSKMCDWWVRCGSVLVVNLLPYGLVEKISEELSPDAFTLKLRWTLSAALKPTNYAI